MCVCLREREIGWERSRCCSFEHFFLAKNNFYFKNKFLNFVFYNFSNYLAKRILEKSALNQMFFSANDEVLVIKHWVKPSAFGEKYLLIKVSSYVNFEWIVEKSFAKCLVTSFFFYFKFWTFNINHKAMEKAYENGKRLGQTNLSLEC